MSLLGRNFKKNDEENVGGLGAARKEMERKRGALGEISNRQAIRQVVPGNPINKNPYKNVQAKVVTHHNGPLKAAEKSKPTLLRRNASSTATTAAVKNNAGKVAILKTRSHSAAQEGAVQAPAAESYSAGLLNVEDIDKDDHEPVLMSVYAVDIYKYLYELENKFKIRPDFLQGQVVTKKMRTILVDWLVEVHHQFHLLQESLYLTIAIIDRFMQEYQTVEKKHLQLVGVAAMSVACKYEEMYAPEISDFVYISDNTYTKEQIQQMEIRILRVLDFNLGRPLPLHFLRRFSKASGADATIHTFGKYFMELCLCEYKMCHLPPSMVAAACMFLALYIHSENEPVWTDTLVYYTTYRLEEIKPVTKLLASIVVNAPEASHQATRTKYKSSVLLKISARPELSSKKLKDYAADPEL